MTNFNKWEKSATGKFLKKKGLTKSELKEQYKLNKKFWKDTHMVK